MFRNLQKLTRFAWGLIPLGIVIYLFWNANYNTPEDRAYRAFNHMAQRLQDKLQPQARQPSFLDKLDMAWHRFIHQISGDNKPTHSQGK